MSPLPSLADPAAPANPPVGRRDVVYAAVYAVLAVLLAASGIHNSGFLAGGEAWSPGISLALMLTGCASMLWRRRRPMVTLAVAGPLSIAEIIGGGQISAYFLLFEALFDPVMHGSRRQALWTTRGAIVGAALAIGVALVLGMPGPIVLLIAIVCTLVVMTPLLWGWEVRHHREARTSAEQLAGLEHELAATRAARAVEIERRSIAHDLHDVISGHLSAVSLHTSLASSLEDPGARDRSLRVARESSHAALRDLRSMIGVLSTAEPGSLPQATLDWPPLIERLRGRDPEARVALDPAVTDPARVEPSVQAALLRIAAEASTNAVRHGLAPISLEVRVEATEVQLVLRNRCSGTSAPGTGVGRGAIAHRATAVGGSATSGPVPLADSAGTGSGGSALGADGPGSSGDGAPVEGWQVLARLPARAAATTVTTPEENAAHDVLPRP